MKKIYYIVLLTFATLLPSCKLDIAPEHTLTTENAFLTEKELNTTTTSIHLFLNIEASEDIIFPEVGEVLDETFSGNNGIREWNPRSVVERVPSWTNLYNVIYEGNLLLDNIHRTQGLTDERVHYHKGQAYFGMAYAYFLLAQRYGDVIITENSTNLQPYPISPQIEVVNKAIELAKKGFDILPTQEYLTDMDGAKIRNKQFASKGSCAALLAHLYAWKGSIIEIYGYKEDPNEAYTKSVEYASMLINGKVGPYQLCATVRELCEKLSDMEQVNPEEIFSFAFDHARSEYAYSSTLGRFYVSWPVDDTRTLGDLTMSTDYRVYKSTVEKLFADPTDERRQEYFYKLDQEHIVDEKSYAILYKWRKAIYSKDEFSETGKRFRSLKANNVVWRLADILLLRAECYAKLGQDAAAIADINTIRRRANAQPYPAPGDPSLKMAVFQERERELFAEGKRYFDVVRNKLYRKELQGKFETLSPEEVKDGALHLPIPRTAYTSKSGRVVNPLIRQSNYWLRYM